MATVDELMRQIEALQAQVAEAQKQEQDEAISTCRDLIAKYELTPKQLFGGHRASRASSPVAAKYRDPATGKTWSGRGKPPVWIKDQNREDFLI